MKRIHANAIALVIAFVAMGCLLSCGDDPNSLSSTRRGTSSSSSSSSSGTSGDTSSSSGSSGTSSVVGTGSTMDELCWSTINELRKKDGLPPFQRWTDAEACSDGEAQSDGSKNDAHGSFPRCGEISQNECPGFKGPAETAIPYCLNFMYSQPTGEGHHDNMASTKWTKLACGTYVTPSNSVWSIQNFH